MQVNISLNKHQLTRISTSFKERKFLKVRLSPIKSAAIDPDFIYAYTSSICNSNNLQEVRRCVECLQIPPYEDQVKIMQVIRELSRSIDITIIQGPIMNLLVENKIDQVNEILGALREYQEAASTLKDMAIAAMPAICLHLDVI